MNRQSGATIIEFALVLIVFLTFLLGITDFSRMLFTWSAANEATRAGARFAVVCDDTGNKAQVLAKMQALLPQIADINLAWSPAGCTAATCDGVTVTDHQSRLPVDIAYRGQCKTCSNSDACFFYLSATGNNETRPEQCCNLFLISREITMKIALISPNRNNLQEMGRVLEAGSHSVSLIDGGKSKMRAVAELEQPDILLVEGMCCDPHDLGQVEYVTTHHPNVAVILLCSTNTSEFLINSMRVGVREVLPSPVTAGALEAAVSRIAAKRIGVHATPPGKILAFIPCKGGSGATFLATNLGYQLAETKSVLLIDLNLQFGDALSFVHDGKPASTLVNIAHDISRLDASFLAASAVKVTQNFSILAAPEDPSQAMEVKPEHIDAILNLAVTQYDFILLDIARTLDTLSIKALDRAYRIFPVLQAGLPYLRNATKLLAVFKSLGYPADKTELIVNRFEKGGEIGIEDMRRSLGAVSLHTVPNSYKEVNASINHGDPLIEMARSNAVTRNLAEFALSLSPKQEENRSLLGRLFRRA